MFYCAGMLLIISLYMNLPLPCINPLNAMSHLLQNYFINNLTNLERWKNKVLFLITVMQLQIYG